MTVYGDKNKDLLPGLSAWGQQKSSSRFLGVSIAEFDRQESSANLFYDEHAVDEVDSELYCRLSGVRVYDAECLITASGYSDNWIKAWNWLQNFGFIYGVRAKAASLQNHVYATDTDSTWKDIDYAEKTAKAIEAERGHLAVREELIGVPELVNPTDPTCEVYRIRYNPKDREGNYIYEEDGSKKEIETYATFERQTISSILSQIHDGRYKVITVDVEPDTDPEYAARVSADPVEAARIADARRKARTYAIIEDQTGRQFKISFDPADFRDGASIDGYYTVGAIHSRFEYQSSKNLNKALKYVENLELFMKIMNVQGMSKNAVLSKTVRLMRYEDNGTGVREVNNKPHIICDGGTGIPVKGDTDTQNMLTPTRLPPEVLKLANVFEGKARFFEDLDELERTIKECKLAEVDKRVLLSIVFRARKRLNKMDPDAADTRIRLLGNIPIIHAALVLDLNTSVRHGEDAYSPVMPENTVITHTPVTIAKAQHKDKVYVTHNEYESVLLSLVKEDNHYQLFNPCWFVRGPWREDLGNKETEGVQLGAGNHPCKNRTDQDVNIELQKLRFKQHLLALKLKFFEEGDPDKFERYLKMIIDNNNEMQTNQSRKKLHTTEFNDMWEKGIEVQYGIIAAVRNTKVRDIQSKLLEIKEKAASVELEQASSKVFAQSANENYHNRYLN